MSGTDNIRSAVKGADRAFGVISGGKGKVPGDPPTSGKAKIAPVATLGHVGGRFYFLDAVGQARDLAARSLGNKQELISLFGGTDHWLREQFPKYAPKADTAEGQPVELVVVDFLVNKTAQWLMEECFKAGIYGDHLVLRKPGVWPDSSGVPAVHCGDAVRIAGAWRPAGERSPRPDGKVIVWAAASPATRPGTPCEASIGAQLQQDIQALFRFRNPGGAIVALGVLGASYFGAAARWRPSLFLTGTAGCGKSTLLSIFRACSPMHSFSNDTSKAGLTGAINGRAMICLIDENEKSDDVAGRAAKTLMDLVLTASGGDGTEGLRANVDGTVRHISMVGSFAMAATSVPEMRDTHLGRIAVLDMEKPAEGEDYRLQHDALIERMRAFGPHLWARALGAWERFIASLAVFRQALKDNGCAPREMDQFGAILAGWWILTREGNPDARGGLEGVLALDGFIRTAVMVDEGSNARRLVQHFMTFAVQLDRSSAREAIGGLIERVAKHQPLTDHPDDTGGEVGVVVSTRALATHGIRVIRATDLKDNRGRAVPRLGPHGIWINPGATELRRIFEGSDWAAGRWATTFLELPHVRRSPTALKVGSVTCRAIWVPLEELSMQEPDIEDTA